MSKLDETKTQFSNLIALIKLDGKIKQGELKLLENLARLKNFPKEELKLLWDYPAPFSPPKGESGRITMFHSFILMIYMDREIHEKEVHMCYELGVLFGLNFLAVQNILLKLLHAPKIAVDSKFITNTFKTFNN